MSDRPQLSELLLKIEQIADFESIELQECFDIFIEDRDQQIKDLQERMRDVLTLVRIQIMPPDTAIQQVIQAMIRLEQVLHEIIVAILHGVAHDRTLEDQQEFEEMAQTIKGADEDWLNTIEQIMKARTVKS